MELARPAYLASVGKILVSAGYLVALFTVADRYPWLYGGFIFVPAAGLTVVRHLRALRVRPHLRATPTHLEIRLWEVRFLVPWVFVQHHAIAWSAITDVTVRAVTINGVETASLVIGAGQGGGVEIAPGVFAEGARELQQRILDRLAVLRRDAEALRPASAAEPGRNGPDTPGLPVRAPPAAAQVLRGRATLRPAGVALGVALVASAAGHLSALPALVWGWFAAVPLLFSVGLVSRFAAERKVCHVELGADGLKVGSSERESTLYPWERVSHAMTRVTNGKAHGVRVVMRDGGEVVLHGEYGVDFHALQRLIDARLAKGESAPPPARSAQGT